MATSAEAAALTAAYQAQQARTGAVAAGVATALLLRQGDAEDVDSSVADAIDRLLPILRGRRGVSARLGQAYYTGFRRLEVRGSDGFALPDLSEFPLEQVATSLRVVGSVDLKKRIRSIPATADDLVRKAMLDTALRDTAQAFGGAAARHVMNGGREAVAEAVATDKRALGFVRVTKANPCFFCAMLASRGPVYGDDSFAESDPRFIGDGKAKVHDFCECTNEPVYSTDTEWPGRAREFEQAWIDLSDELGHSPSILEWRRHYEGLANSS